MRVRKIFKEAKYNHKINGIKNDSNSVKDNDIFIAICGRKDGHDYIDEAIKKGAKTIVCERVKEICDGINYIIVDDTKNTQAKIAHIFFKNVTKKVKLIGVTGTNGKTTISTLFAEFLLYNGYETLLIGTNGIKYKGTIYKTNNTTPDILLTLNAIYEAYKKGVKYVVMEVSSHAIKELRIKGFDFDVGILSNITHDHLDYHKTFEDYLYTKAFFLSTIRKNIVLNKDIKEFALVDRMSQAKMTSYGINSKADFVGSNINKSMENGTNFILNNKYEIKTSLIGEFNVYNVLAVISCLPIFHLSLDNFIKFLKFYVNVSGRMEMIKIKDRTFIIDYAHTPDGILNVCQNIRGYTNNRITIVVGCGGNRDALKRPIIGDIVTNYADKVIFTNDNPRDEEEEKIVVDILEGVKKHNYEVIYNREKAILKAIKDSKENEIIAILGKGSENEQIIKGIKYPFNDLEIVKKIMKRV